MTADKWEARIWRELTYVEPVRVAIGGADDDE